MVIGGVAVAVGRGWTYTEEDVDVDSTAAGDAWMDSDSLRGRFTVDWRALLEIASPYVLPGNVRGTKATFACHVVAADSNGIVSGTGKVNRFQIEAAYDGMVEVSGSIGSAGTAPAIDTTPAT